LVGYGAIANRLVELLAPFKMQLIGFRRNIRGDEPIRMASIDKIDEFLPQADHVIDILPASESTNHFFNADRFARMKRSAIFYNIGRGTTVDQAALIAALTTGHIGAAYLDVTTPEPLPPEDPLWTAPNCFITPHTAGGHDDESARLVRHFLDNLARFTGEQPLIDRVV
jgi:phosphoglycerate dehydrogenase-like enzyme